MENKTSFDLEGAVASWRASVSAQEAIGGEQARELESHLRDGVAGWIARGLTEQEAFQVAAGRVGGAEKVAAEFAKEDGPTVWRVRFFWMILGMITLRVLGDFGSLMITAPGAFLARMLFPGGLTAGGWPLYAIGMTQVAAMLVVWGSMFFAVKRCLARDGANVDARFAQLCARRGWLAALLVLVVLVGMLLRTSGLAMLARFSGPNEMGRVLMGGQIWSLLHPFALAFLAVMVAPRLGRSKMTGAT